MANAQLATVIRHIRDVAVTREHRDKTDRERLGAFLARRDEDAFTALVKRHGPLVLGVCRRALGHAQDAEDAFQATFLALACGAASVRRPAALPAWLHGTAVRVCRKAARRRPAPPPTLVARDSADPLADAAWKEVRAALDEELA